MPAFGADLEHGRAMKTTRCGITYAPKARQKYCKNSGCNEPRTSDHWRKCAALDLKARERQGSKTPSAAVQPRSPIVLLKQTSSSSVSVPPDPQAISSGTRIQRDDVAGRAAAPAPPSHQLAAHRCSRERGIMDASSSSDGGNDSDVSNGSESSQSVRSNERTPFCDPLLRVGFEIEDPWGAENNLDDECLGPLPALEMLKTIGSSSFDGLRAIAREWGFDSPRTPSNDSDSDTNALKTDLGEDGMLDLIDWSCSADTGPDVGTDPEGLQYAASVHAESASSTLGVRMEEVAVEPVRKVSGVAVTVVVKASGRCFSVKYSFAMCSAISGG